jgi:hypothetical protein
MLANTISARAESLVCACICWFVSGAARDLVNVGQYQELSMNVHVSALLETHDSSACVGPYRELSVFLCVCSRFKTPGMQVQVSAQKPFLRIGWRALRAVLILDMSLCIEGCMHW